MKCSAFHDNTPKPTAGPQIPFVKLDPKHSPTCGNAGVQIPQPGFKIKQILDDRKRELIVEDPDYEDTTVFEHIEKPGTTKDDPVDVDEDDDEYLYDDDDEVVIATPFKGKAKATAAPTRPIDDWKHKPEWVAAAIERRMPPPHESSPSATTAVQRELRAMLKEQKAAKSLKDLGWFLPEEFIDDNLFSWIVEMHSFDENIPIARDMKAQCV